jgi:hypothetical protein
MSLIGALTKAAKAGEAAKKTAPFYSAVDEAMSNLKRPKGTGIEFLTEVLKQPGVKKAEIADRKLEQAFKAKGKMTKEEAQQVLVDNPPPQLRQKVYDESTAIDEGDLREIVSEEMFGRPYSQIRFGSAQHRQISDEVYKRMEMDNGTQYGKYKTPDGENYREILLTLPNKPMDASMAAENWYTQFIKRGGEPDWPQLSPARQKEIMKSMPEEARNYSASPSYTSSHFNEPNVLAHMRVQDRKGPNGEKILHVEEIQSDWHQTGRKKGYKPDDYVQQSNAIDKEFDELLTKRTEIQLQAVKAKYIGGGEGAQALTDEANSMTPKLMKLQEQKDKIRDVINYGVPDAPFKKNWHELAMKRLLNYAADNGYDSIALTPGAEQAKRYDLSKQIDTISWNKQNNGLYGIEADTVNGRPIIKKGMTEQELEDTVGKEVASRIVNGVGQFENDPLFDSGKLTRGKLENLDLKVGGEGMMGFYDKMLPDYLNNYSKSYGSKVEMDSIPVSTRDPQSTSWGAGMPGDHPFMTVQDLNEPFDGMVELMRRNADTGEETLVGRMLRADSERQIAQELRKLDTVNQIKLHNFPITPEMRESIKQKGLPLYQQVGIPTAGAGAASQMLEPEEEAGLAGGGSVAKLAALAKLKKMREEMAPRAEAVKSLIARDENKYLQDVVPNSLTNTEIEAEIKRMAARAQASQPEVKEAKGGEVRMTKNRDTMFMELSNKKLKRK